MTFRVQSVFVFQNRAAADQPISPSADQPISRSAAARFENRLSEYNVTMGKLQGPEFRGQVTSHIFSNCDDTALNANCATLNIPNLDGRSSHQRCGLQVLCTSRYPRKFGGGGRLKRRTRMRALASHPPRMSRPTSCLAPKETVV